MLTLDQLERLVGQVLGGAGWALVPAHSDGGYYLQVATPPPDSSGRPAIVVHRHMRKWYLSRFATAAEVTQLASVAAAAAQPSRPPARRAHAAEAGD